MLDVAQAGNQTIKHEILEQGVVEYARAKAHDIIAFGDAVNLWREPDLGVSPLFQRGANGETKAVGIADNGTRMAI